MSMVEPTTQALTTLFVVSVTVMVFFTTSASRRIEQMESPNLRIIGTLSLVGSYCLLPLLGFIIISATGIAGDSALFTGMEVVFAAFVVPGLVLMYNQVEVVLDSLEDSDFSILWTILRILFVGILYLGIGPVQPTTP